jgi:hypothetical protein
MVMLVLGAALVASTDATCPEWLKACQSHMLTLRTFPVGPLELPGLLEDLKILLAFRNFTAKRWVPGASRSLYDRTVGWSFIPLRSRGGVEGDDGNRHAGQAYDVGSFVARLEPWADTPALERCPHLKRLISSWGAGVESVRLMRLEAGGTIYPHRDGMKEGVMRFHAPLLTHDGVHFLLTHAQSSRSASFPPEGLQRPAGPAQPRRAMRAAASSKREVGWGRRRRASSPLRLDAFWPNFADLVNFSFSFLFSKRNIEGSEN